MRALHPVGQRAESRSRHNNGCSHSGSETEIQQSYIEALERFAVGSLCRPPSLARVRADLRKALRPDPLRATIGETATAPPPKELPINAAAAGSPRAPSEAASLPESTLALARRPSRGRRRAARESGGPRAPGGKEERSAGGPK